MSRETSDSQETILLRPASGAFDVDAIARHASTLPGVIADPFVEHLFLLAADNEYAREAVVNERRACPHRFPYVGVLRIGASAVVIHQYASQPARELGVRIARWVVRQWATQISDELGRPYVDAGKAFVRVGGTPRPADDEGLPALVAVDSARGEPPPLAPLSVEAAGAKCVRREVELYAPRQTSTLYEYVDGTVVWVRPKGTFYRPGPMYRVGVVVSGRGRWRGPEDTAFHVNAKGDPVPKSVADLRSPFPDDGFQDLVYKATLIDAGDQSPPEG